MAGAKRFRKKSRKKSQSKSPRKRAWLDIYSPGDIKKLKGIAEQALKFHWDYYCSLAYQRSKITDEIKRALLKATKENFEFTRILMPQTHLSKWIWMMNHHLKIRYGDWMKKYGKNSKVNCRACSRLGGGLVFKREC